MALADIGPLRPELLHLLSIWNTASTAFLGRLDRLDPRLRYLLPRGLLRYVRRGIARALHAGYSSESCAPRLRQLGRHLRRRGLEPLDFDTLGAAVLTTLDEVMGSQPDRELREELVRLYRFMLPEGRGS